MCFGGGRDKFSDLIGVRYLGAQTMGDTTQLPTLEQDLQAVQGADLERLRRFWRDRWGAPPQLRSVRLLQLIIAWRLQESLEGGLDSQTRRLLKGTSTPRWGRPATGTRLTREYRGVLHEVEVRATSFVYAGREFPNLTRIAQEITGTHWNGPRFFGLRDQDVVS